MTPDASEESLFAEALQRVTPDARADYLATACGTNTALRRRVEALLRAADNAGDFLEAPTEGLGGGSDAAALAIELSENPGDRIDRYKLLEKVGEGGCGVVYVAEQTEPMRRRVAVKVIKLGMDTRSVVARFEVERQALAMMDHPNIARVFDAGTTELGRPYFVMELVRGVRITDYCDQAQLTTRERLDLFIKVCQAVQHAHQKGIIHRDIKPSNILVTLHDGVPVPKVIDFGIAKATEERLIDTTVYTRLHQFLGTPAYMSPEQAEMSGLDIDTRSDIYSLGVLLYELLAGSTPFDGKELIASGIDAMRKTIREQEPVRPSTRFATLGDDASTPTARSRSVDTSKLFHQLRGDLDWIVMKCLEKDRGRRYDTANGLAADIKRHLANEPVIARPPSAGYRFQKAFRRNRRLFIAGTAIAAALLLGVVVSTWQAIRARQAEREQSRLRAEADQARANETGQRRIAESERRRAEAQTYASDMNLAQQALAMNNLGRAAELLARHRPAPESARREASAIPGSSGSPATPDTQPSSDLRGWEWRYLWQQTQGDETFTLCQKPIAIFSLAVSPDARLLAVGEENHGYLTLWDIPSRREILRLPVEDDPDLFYVRTAFSPTEPLLAYGSASGFPPTNLVSRVRIWNLTTHRQVSELPLEFLCTGLAFSPDGAVLMTSTINFLTLWDVRTGAKLRTYPVGSHQQIGTPFSVTPDFRLAAQAFSPGKVRVFDVVKGKELWNINASAANIEAVALSGDGRRLASADANAPSVVRIWDAQDGRAIASLNPCPGGVMQLLFGPDDRTLISAHTDQTIRVWDVSDPAAVPPPRILIGHPLEVWRLALIADGKTLISGGKDGSVKFWDLTRPSRQRGAVTLPGRPIVGWSFGDRSSDLLTCDDQGRITRWSGPGWQTTKLLAETGSEVSGACFLVDRQEVVLAGRDDVLRVIRLVDPGAPRMLAAFPGKRFPYPWSWTLRRHGNRFSVGRFDQQIVHDYDIDSWELRETWHAPGTLCSMDFSPDGRYCVMGTYRGRVVLRNLATGEESVFVEHMPRIGRVGFSPSGDRLGISTEQGFVRWWHTGSWQDAGTLGGFLHAVAGVSFSPDGQRFVAGSAGKEAIRLYELEGRQPLLALEAEGGGYSPAFDSGGDVLAAVNAEGKPSVWRAPSWEEIGRAERALPGAVQERRP